MQKSFNTSGGECTAYSGQLTAIIPLVHVILTCLRRDMISRAFTLVNLTTYTHSKRRDGRERAGTLSLLNDPCPPTAVCQTRKNETKDKVTSKWSKMAVQLTHGHARQHHAQCDHALDRLCVRVYAP